MKVNLAFGKLKVNNIMIGIKKTQLITNCLIKWKKLNQTPRKIMSLKKSTTLEALTEKKRKKWRNQSSLEHQPTQCTNQNYGTLHCWGKLNKQLYSYIICIDLILYSYICLFVGFSFLSDQQTPRTSSSNLDSDDNDDEDNSGWTNVSNNFNFILSYYSYNIGLTTKKI